MRIYLTNSWVLTDEHPMETERNPVLMDLETRMIYDPGDMVGAVSALQVVSQAVEERGESYFLPEENLFISRFIKGAHESQSVHVARVGNLFIGTYPSPLKMHSWVRKGGSE